MRPRVFLLESLRPMELAGWVSCYHGQSRGDSFVQGQRAWLRSRRLGPLGILHPLLSRACDSAPSGDSVLAQCSGTAAPLESHSSVGTGASSEGRDRDSESCSSWVQGEFLSLLPLPSQGCGGAEP